MLQVGLDIDDDSPWVSIVMGLPPNGWLENPKPKMDDNWWYPWVPL